MPSRNHPMWLRCVGFITKPFSICTHHLYDYISTRYHEQLTTNFFRECCLTIMLENSEKIGGNGVEVEIGKSKFGKRKYYRGH